MRRRTRPDLLLALAALLSVVTLLGLSAALQPPRVPLGDLAEREGGRVEVAARVLDANPGPRARALTLTDGAHRVRAFAPLDLPVERGDEILAEGIVARDERALVLSIDTLAVVAPSLLTVRDPVDLAREPWAFDGARVSVAGEARGGALAGGGARVGLAGDALPRDGDVVVTGTFGYRESTASYVVWVASWTPRS